MMVPLRFIGLLTVSHGGSQSQLEGAYPFDVVCRPL